jgi:hypothetical protein
MRNAYLHCLVGCLVTATSGIESFNECTFVPFAEGSSLLQGVLHKMDAMINVDLVRDDVDAGSVREKLSNRSVGTKRADKHLTKGANVQGNLSSPNAQVPKRVRTAERTNSESPKRHTRHTKQNFSRGLKEQHSNGHPFENYVQWFQWGAEVEVCILIIVLATCLATASLHYAGIADLSPKLLLIAQTDCQQTACENLGEGEACVTAQSDNITTNDIISSTPSRSTKLRGYSRVPAREQHLPQQLIMSPTKGIFSHAFGFSWRVQPNLVSAKEVVFSGNSVQMM